MKTKIIDFSPLIAKSTEAFTGRQWVRDAVDAFLKSNSPRHFLLLGEPGSGKTAFMADLVRRTGYPHHFIGKGCQIDITQESIIWCEPIRFTESVGYQLVCDYGGWIMSWEDWGISVEQELGTIEGLLLGAKVEEFKARLRCADKPLLSVKQRIERFGQAAEVIGVYIEKLEGVSPEQAVYQLLLKPLQNIVNRFPEHQVVIVVDGLDEAKNYSDPKRNILNMLPNGSLPENIRFILSSRPGEHLTPSFKKQAQIFWLSDDDKGQIDPHTIDDARAFVLDLAGQKPIKEMLVQRGILTETFTQRVANASQGNFLYLHHYANSLREGDETKLDLEALPEGLYEIYEDFITKIKERVPALSKADKDYKWNEIYKPVLGTLAVVKEPILQQQIADISHVKRDLIATILMQLKEFLDSTGKRAETRYCVYHKSFAEYLISEDNANYYIDGQEAHKRIIEYYKTRTSSWKEAYAMKYLLSHMIAAHSWDEIEVLLTNIEYLKEKQSPTAQYSFQDDFILLLQNKEIPTGKLISILEGILKVVCQQLKNDKLKADWLDTFAYWINEFCVKDQAEKSLALKNVAKKFDYSCGDVSRKLAESYLKTGENDWALRFAGLYTWVYQRAEEFERCAKACEYAEKICTLTGMEDTYKSLGQAVFVRLRALALTKLEVQAADSQKEKYRVKARKTYIKLNDVFSAVGEKCWKLTVEEWQNFEKGATEILYPASQKRSDTLGLFHAKVVSNEHDCISAMYIIQFFEEKGGLVEWVHHKNFKLEDFASEDTLFTVLIGGPKSPGISEVAGKFYETDKENYLRMYSGLYCEAHCLKTTVGRTHCYMLGGISGTNTLMAAYEFTKDDEVIKIISKLNNQKK